jgi:hypothetical protein
VYIVVLTVVRFGQYAKGLQTFDHLCGGDGGGVIVSTIKTATTAATTAVVAVVGGVKDAVLNGVNTDDDGGGGGHTGVNSSVAWLRVSSSMLLALPLMNVSFIAHYNGPKYFQELKRRSVRHWRRIVGR